MGRGARAGLLAVAVGLLAPRAAVAHGGTWRADQLLVDPGTPGRVVIQSDDWGTVVASPGGAHEWLCPETYGSLSTSTERASVALLPDGTMLVARKFAGLMRSAGTNLCSFDSVPFFDDPARCGGSRCIVQHVEQVGGRTLVLANAASAGGVPATLLWESNDGAATFQPLPDTIPSELSGNAVAASATDPARLYVVALPLADQGSRALLASVDGGATWVPTTVATDAAIAAQGDAPPVLRIAAVHPADPDVVFLWLDYADRSGTPLKGPDRMLLSTDGGATLREVLAGTDHLPGFALSPDGATVAFAGPSDGVFTASMDGLRSSGGAAVTKVNGSATWGLAWTAEGLLAGRDDFAVPPLPRFALGVSTDGGKTFAPRMTMCDVTPLACPGGSSADPCAALFDGPGGFEVDFIKPRCTGASGVDGGSPDGAAPAPDAGGQPGKDAGKDAGPPPGARDAGTVGQGSPSSSAADGGCCTVAPIARPVGPSETRAALASGLVAVLCLRRRRRRP